MYKFVALTINNFCNMRCEHCYLNYDSASKFMSDEVFSHVTSVHFLRGIERVIVVGMEPLVNQRSRDLLRKMATTLSSQIAFEIITNGYGLVELDPTTAGFLSEIDISLDGGPRTYGAYRGAVTVGSHKDVYARIVAGVKWLRGITPITILHTLSSAVYDVEDMMDVAEMGPKKILFSPFVSTSDVTNPQLKELSIEAMMQILADSGRFMASDKAFFVLGTHSSRGKTREELRQLTAQYGLTGKVKWIGDSSEYVRVTHDGLVLDSRTALSPSKYLQVGIDCRSLTCIQDFASSTRM